MTHKKEQKKSLKQERLKSLPQLIVCVCMLSFVQLFETPLTVACQPRLSMEFPRQEYWRGLRFTSTVDLANPGIKPVSLCLLSKTPNHRSRRHREYQEYKGQQYLPRHLIFKVQKTKDRIF